MAVPRRVLLVDDHPLFRSGLRQALDREHEFEVTAEAAMISEAKSSVAESRFDVAVVDISLPDGSGLELVAWLGEHAPELPVLVMSMHDSAEFVRNAFRQGARGYLTKGSPASEVAEALRIVADGGAYAGAEVARLVIGPGAQAESGGDILDTLTAREREVATQLSRGLRAAEVALELGISAKTVESHRGNIYRKLDIRNVVELTRLVAPESGV